MKEEDAGQNIVIPKYTGGRFYCLWLNGEEKDRVLFRFKIGSLRIRSLGVFRGTGNKGTQENYPIAQRGLRIYS